MLRSPTAHLPLSSLASSSRRTLTTSIYARAPSVLRAHRPPPQQWVAASAAVPIPSPSAPALPAGYHRSPWTRRDVRYFHATPRREGLPVLGAALLSVFKSSGAIELARMVGRITLSLSTLILMKNFKTRKWLKYAPAAQTPEFESKRTEVLYKMRRRTILFHALMFTPVLLFWASIMASLERTPLTGRWRTILLSPEEEDEIAASLANGGWYSAVSEIISQEGSATIIPRSDWRYHWVESVLRRLESTIAIIQQEHTQDAFMASGNVDALLPPPADFPLRGRPRASEYLHSLCEAMVNKHPTPASHGIPGAPYSLMLVEDPKSCNAFSYGFGPDGAGGIVVYSGFIDEILARAPSIGPEDAVAAPQPTSWLSALFGGLSAPGHTSVQPAVTGEQTGELATLLAHELAHLVLAHHLEMLSSGTIVVPGFMSLVTDFVRVLFFPVTMIFGPFVNDALANVGKASTRDFTRMHETCTSTYQEIEADVVSMRLLAYAGFDARDAVRFWEKRIRANAGVECSSSRAEQAPPGSASALTKKITGDSHPVAETRILRLKEELQRWEEQRRERLDQLRARAAASDGQ